MLDSSIYLPDVEFQNKILILGYGAVGQAILPLIIRHIDVPLENIIVIEKDNNKQKFLRNYENTGIQYRREEIRKDNFQDILSANLSSGDLIVNCSLHIDAGDLLSWCMENGVMQIDTSIERWGTISDEDIPNIEERTLHHAHQTLRDKIGNSVGKPTCLVTHGANPGAVSHFVKMALINLAKQKRIPITIPSTKEDWAQLSKLLEVRVIHISEKDRQIINEPKKVDEFVNTWSCEGYFDELRAPAELGVGSHESEQTLHYMNLPGASVKVKSWVPSYGEYAGFLIQHSESVTINQYLTTEDGSYSPSVYYVYHPIDAAVNSIHEMVGNQFELQNNLRIVKNEVVSGIDELGVFLIGPGFSFWHGSQLSTERARDLIPGENATTVQVAGSMIAAIVWMIKNPNRGYMEPDDLPFEEILNISDYYWEPIISVMGDWGPLKNKSTLFQRKYNTENEFSLENFLL